MNMKKTALLALLTWVMMMPAWGQSDDVVISGSNDLRYENTVPLAGNNAINTMKGRRIYGGDFSAFFLEGVTMLSDYDYSMGFGCTFGYVPGRWGVYGTFVSEPYWNSYYDNTMRLSVGAVLRPVMSSILDWQLYGGLSMGRTAGFDVGMRFAPDANGNHGGFGWWSCSIGRLYTTEACYTTIGVSIDIALFTTCIIFF